MGIGGGALGQVSPQTLDGSSGYVSPALTAQRFGTSSYDNVIAPTNPISPQAAMTGGMTGGSPLSPFKNITQDSLRVMGGGYDGQGRAVDGLGNVIERTAPSGQSVGQTMQSLFKNNAVGVTPNQQPLQQTSIQDFAPQGGFTTLSNLLGGNGPGQSLMQQSAMQQNPMQQSMSYPSAPSSSNSLNSMPSAGSFSGASLYGGGSGGSGGSGGPFPLEGKYGIVKMANGGLASAAQNMAGRGRDGDSMLVHMSPGEVKGLQALAMAHGGSLSVNPDTGLVEASFLKRILPMIAGAGLMMIPGVGPLAAAGMVGGFETLRTGDIGKGLMAGLGAYGGAGMAQGLAGAAGSAATEASAANALGAGANVGTGATSQAGMLAAENASMGLTPLESAANISSSAGYASGAAPMSMGAQSANLMSAGAKNIATNPMTAGPQAYAAMPTGTVPALGATVANAMTPEAPPIPGAPEEDPRYAGSPYRYNLASGFQGSTPTRPSPYYRPTGLGYAAGGDVKKEEVSAPKQGYQPISVPKEGPLSGDIGKSIVAIMNATGGRGFGLGNAQDSHAQMGYQPRNAVVSRSEVPVTNTQLQYEIDPRTGQIYTPRGLGYTGYAEGGDVMMAAGGSYDDEGMGDNPGMASGGIAGYAAGGLKMGQGIARDTDTDTARLGAYDAAKKRMEKQFAAAGLKPRDMPKSGIAKLGQIKAMAEGGLGGYSDGGRMLKGPGDGMSDDIPAVIGKRQPARLADGEFVVPADVVSHLGNGSTDAGAKKLYSMMDKVRTARTGKKKQAPAVKASKYMPA
jgi:hypothetical protein